MRLYTKEGDFTFTTYNTCYMRIKFGSTLVTQKIHLNSPTTISAPRGLEFNDTETIIYGADQIIDLGDLSNKYAGTIDVSKCSKLQSLTIGNKDKINSNLISISLGNNPLLKTINIQNCVSLKGDLDVSAAVNLEEIDARGTSISSITLPQGGNLKKIYLPNTLSTLVLRNLKNLEIQKSYNLIKSYY